VSPPVGSAGSAGSARSVARRLLVAMPGLRDPNFARTVVFVIEHDLEGAVGLVLNRPTDATVAEALPDWAPLTAPPGVAFVGGPVQQHEAVFGLARVARVDDSDAWQPLLGRIGTVDLGRDPVAVRADLEAVRVFAGYSGWGPGQLDEELALDGWYVLDPLPDDLLTHDPAGLWRRVLRRQGGDLAVAANFPDDPAQN
jgi:putative transcriptional regulator